MPQHAQQPAPATGAGSSTGAGPSTGPAPSTNAGRSTRAGASDPPEVERILDAAEERFTDVGVRLTTLNDIARAAGVSRVTVYRRVGGRGEVARAVVTRSAARLIADVEAAARQARTMEELISEAFATTVGLMREHPLWNRMVTLDRENALPQITLDGQDVLQAAIHAALAMFATSGAGHAFAESDDLAARVEVLVRVVHSVILTPRAVTPLETHEQLVGFARAHLVPVLLRDGPVPADG